MGGVPGKTTVEPSPLAGERVAGWAEWAPVGCSARTAGRDGTQVACARVWNTGGGDWKRRDRGCRWRRWHGTPMAGRRPEHAGEPARTAPFLAPRVAGRRLPADPAGAGRQRSEEHTSELQSLLRISYAV